MLSKKHGQLKGVIQALVEQTMGWLEEIKARDGLEKWLELVETLRSITEGKVPTALTHLSIVPLMTLTYCSSARSFWKHLGRV